MCFFESLEGKNLSAQLSVEFQNREQNLILCRDSCCLIALLIVLDL